MRLVSRSHFGPRVMTMAAVLVSALLAWLPATVSAQQQCTIQAQPSVVTLSLTVSDNSIPVGTAISNTAATSIAVTCPASRSGFRVLISPTYYVPNTMPSVWAMRAFPGAGLRVTDGNGRVVSNRDASAPDLSRSIATINSPTGYRGTITLNHQLIKYRNLEFPPPGRIDFGVVYALHSYDNATRTASGPLAYVSINNGVPPVPTCTVTTGNVNVELPTISATSLRTAGATAGKTAFSVGLSCLRSNSSVYVTLTDATTSGNRTDLLTLAGDATARGIGIRIRRSSNVPVSFGPDSSDAGNPNQWLVGVARTTASIPMTAEYVATDNVTPGNVRALATFTMNYQ